MEDEKLLLCFSNKEIIEKLKETSVLVTGATGLIGQTVIKALLKANEKCNLNIKIYAFIRNREKAIKVFQQSGTEASLMYIQGNIVDKICITENIDYVIHGASITDSGDFVTKPVETINTGIIGTENVLEFAREKNVKSIVYLSSMEVYGRITEKRKLKEVDMGYLNPLEVRSSYSESKRMIENICISFFSEYGIPVKIIRLAQTFGPGVEYKDNRVFAEFARCVIEKKDIVLHTSGKSERMYLYSYDAADAILTVLVRGVNGFAYNAANQNTYCSIKQMAELVKTKIAKDAINVVIEDNQEKVAQYSPEHYLYLDTEELVKLGWCAKTDLITAYEKMIGAMRKENGELEYADNH